MINNVLIPKMLVRKQKAMQITDEIENFQKEIDKISPKIILEIGTANGGTLARWFEIDSVEMIISLDLPVGIHGGKGYEERVDLISEALLQANKTNKKFYAINGNSTDETIISSIDEILDGRKVDFLFIDGDHTYDGVSNDFLNYQKFLGKGSIVGFHDIIDTEYHRSLGCFVADFWNKIKSDFTYKEFIHTENLKDSTNEWDQYMYSKGGFGGIGMLYYGEKIEDKITFIIPSVNRPSLIETIKSLMNQTNPNWECIIVYDGVDGFLFTDKRIKLITTEKKGRFNKINGEAGLVRNVALAKTTTKWIGFLDDDDTLHPDYVKDLFERYSNYDFVVWRMKYKNNLVLPKIDSDELIRGQVGISFCYKNKFENLLFDENKDGEDFDFLMKLKRLTKNYIITPEIRYNAGNTLNIPNIPNSDKSLTWLAKFDDYSSMGILSQRVVENLKTTDVSCQSIIGESTTSNGLIHNLLSKRNNYELGIMFAYPDMYPVLNEYKTKVIYTGVDSTGGIPNFAQNANNADFLLTPSNKSKERMEKLGVTKPIFVFPHGVDPNIFKFKERAKSDVFKFLYVGECSDRKGIFHLLNAFISEFRDNEKVELHIKSNNDMLFYDGDKIKEVINSNKNIFWHTGNEGHDYVLELYSSCHVYVYPSRADTFGMTLLEAMACGLPIISTGEPGATELINGRYYHVLSKDIPVRDHPWMLGEWGEPSIEHLRMLMKSLHDKYDEVVLPEKLKENSDYIIQNYSWDKVTERFENEILPKFKKEYKVLTLLTSYNRPHHIKNIIENLKDIREKKLTNDIYIVENSDTEVKNDIVNHLKSNIDDRFKLHVSNFNMGQRGALLQMLDDVNIDDYDYIQFTDQDNIFNEPVSTFCDILNENPDAFFVTGYMSKEHSELGWRETRHGNLCEKRSLRAGHMVLRKNDLKSLFPLHLDAHYGQPYNSTWKAGLDWELSWWNPKSAGKNRTDNFVLCLPGGVLHKGIDSTMYDWPVEENEYSLEELERMR